MTLCPALRCLALPCRTNNYFKNIFMPMMMYFAIWSFPLGLPRVAISMKGGRDKEGTPLPGSVGGLSISVNVGDRQIQRVLCIRRLEDALSLACPALSCPALLFWAERRGRRGIERTHVPFFEGRARPELKSRFQFAGLIWRIYLSALDACALFVAMKLN